LIDRGINVQIKESYYRNDQVVDWNNLKAVLDVRKVKKKKYEYLLSWQNSTVGNDTWVAEQHIPLCLKSYVEQFRKTHEQLYEKTKKPNSKEKV
jgi:hypothetical protein